MPNPYPLISRDEFRDLAKVGKASTDVRLSAPSVKLEALGENRTKFRITEETEDREKDIIKASGWNTRNYAKNPVVLWAHNYRDLPVARTVKLTKDATGMSAIAEYVPFDTPIVGEKAEAISRLVKGRFLNAASVGFRPLDYSWNEERGGVDFKKTELLEWSFVPVPAHQDALAEQRAAFARAKSEGVDLAALDEWMVRGVDELTDEALAVELERRGFKNAAAVLKRADAIEIRTDGETVIFDHDERDAEESSAAKATVDVKVDTSDLKALVERFEVAAKAITEKATPDGDGFVFTLDGDDDETILTLTDDDAVDRITIDADAIRDGVIAAMQDSVRDVVGNEVRSALRAARGLVD